MAVGVACKAILRAVPGLKVRLPNVWILSRKGLHFCVRGTPSLCGNIKRNFGRVIKSMGNKASSSWINVWMLQCCSGRRQFVLNERNVHWRPYWLVNFGLTYLVFYLLFQQMTDTVKKSTEVEEVDNCTVNNLRWDKVKTQLRNNDVILCTISTSESFLFLLSLNLERREWSNQWAIKHRAAE